MLGNDEIEKLYLEKRKPLEELASEILGLEYRDDAEDIVQDAFVRLCENRDNVKSVPTWLNKVVENLSWDFLKKKAHVGPLDDVEEADLAAEDGGLEDLSVDVRQAVLELPVGIRRVWQMYWVDQIPRMEIAQRNGISTPTVNRALGKAKRYLQKRLGDYFEAA